MSSSRIVLVPLAVAVLSIALLVGDPPARAAAAPPVPSGFSLVAGGAGYSGLRFGWVWARRAERYDIAVSTDPSFRRLVTHRVVTSPRRRPAGGRLAATVVGLRQATVYYARIQGVRGSSVSRWSPRRRTATRIGTPQAMSGVTARPGPAAGQVTVAWRSTGRSTTDFVVDTALTTFSQTDPALPDRGRNAQRFVVARTARSLTLTAAQVAAAGAPVGSGLPLYVRLWARNRGTAGSRVTFSPSLLAVTPRPAPPGTGPSLRVGSFNVRTAKDSADHPWLGRGAEVAAQIVASGAGVVGLQELSPARADGVEGPVAGAERQTSSLLRLLSAAGGASYRLTRSGAYAGPTTTLGQGARILYDADRYELLSACPETDGGDDWSAACTVTLPLRAGDPEAYRRAAAVARFRDRSSGVRFWVVSAHLDPRTSTDVTLDAGFDRLRATQVQTLVAAVDRLDTAGEPVVFTGDINSWQGRPAGDRTSAALWRLGFADAVATAAPVGLAYSTYNAYATTVPANRLGYSSRVDVIKVRGGRGSLGYRNVVTVTAPTRSSDHNLQVATVVLPG